MTGQARELIKKSLFFNQAAGEVGKRARHLASSRAFVCQGHPDSPGFVLGFFEFGSGVGVGDDAGADVVGEGAFFVNEGADGDVELGFAVEAEVADGSSVEAAWGGFEFLDDFHGTFLGRAGD